MLEVGLTVLGLGIMIKKGRGSWEFGSCNGLEDGKRLQRRGVRNRGYYMTIWLIRVGFVVKNLDG